MTNSSNPLVERVNNLVPRLEEATAFHHDTSELIASATCLVLDLAARLEITHMYNGLGQQIPFGARAYDGIACRDVTINLLEDRIEELKDERDAYKAVANNKVEGEIWYWQGDGHDDPESLSCHVVMSADQLRALLNTPQRDDA